MAIPDPERMHGHESDLSTPDSLMSDILQQQAEVKDLTTKSLQLLEVGLANDLIAPINEQSEYAKLDEEGQKRAAEKINDLGLKSEVNEDPEKAFDEQYEKLVDTASKRYKLSPEKQVKFRERMQKRPGRYDKVKGVNSLFAKKENFKKDLDGQSPISKAEQEILVEIEAEFRDFEKTERVAEADRIKSEDLNLIYKSTVGLQNMQVLIQSDPAAWKVFVDQKKALAERISTAETAMTPEDIMQANQAIYLYSINSLTLTDAEKAEGLMDDLIGYIDDNFNACKQLVLNFASKAWGFVEKASQAFVGGSIAAGILLSGNQETKQSTVTKISESASNHGLKASTNSQGKTIIEGRKVKAEYKGDSADGKVSFSLQTSAGNKETIIMEAEKLDQEFATLQIYDSLITYLAPLLGPDDQSLADGPNLAYKQFSQVFKYLRIDSDKGEDLKVVKRLAWLLGDHKSGTMTKKMEKLRIYLVNESNGNALRKKILELKTPEELLRHGETINFDSLLA